MAPQTEVKRLKRQVADSSHILFHQGLVDFHGHVSARIPGTNSILINPVLRPRGARPRARRSPLRPIPRHSLAVPRRCVSYTS